MITFVVPTGYSLDDAFEWAKAQSETFNVKVIIFINGKVFTIDKDTDYLETILKYTTNKV